ncbi:hypothetical protein Sango_2812600 [Sesamum angolense]|uniref:Reverse transcriptase/retrotransposon-derived protein RNase H-like domain-containing protein n=1 Tax=Sesamum angolense TaxID=2727404 RepID=A0AAE1VXK0_9LAMI|nr:hypothetical protein Sango_2812600 [Sesamum angolense]
MHNIIVFPKHPPLLVAASPLLPPHELRRTTVSASFHFSAADLDTLISARRHPPKFVRRWALSPIQIWARRRCPDLGDDAHRLAVITGGDDRENVASSNYINNDAEEDITQVYHITLIEDGEVEEEDAKDAPIELEEGVKVTIDELKEVNFGSSKDPRPILHKCFTNLGRRGVVREVKYPMLISNIIHVRKKNWQIRICVEFMDLNNACPKDDFPLPIAELMTYFNALSGLRISRTLLYAKECQCHIQRVTQRIFNGMLHKNVKCYADNLVVKSKKQEDHLHDLRNVFERLRRYQLKMNLSKYAFGVTSEKFLGFIVHQRGLEIQQANIDVILRMPKPQNIHELQSLQGNLAYLRRFISNLVGRCQPFSRLMKKDVSFEWDEACDKVFKNIKSYLMKPPILVAPVLGRPLILYIAAHERSVGILLAQKNDEGQENALYYLSRTMTPNELKY